MCCFLVFPSLLTASDKKYNFKLLTGASYQVKNDVQIPNSNLGTRFSLEDTVGEGPVSAVRLEVNWQLNNKHGLRFLLAPLSYDETVEFADTVNFNGQTFAANTPTVAGYKFNSWRIGYHYTLIDNSRHALRVGGTLKIRDAEIRLEQNGAVSTDDDLGLVPLLHIASERNFGNDWYIGADIDALAGGPGRAIDAGVTLGRAIGNRWHLGAELRVLEGGADVDSVYNFAQFNSASAFIGARF